MPFWSKIIACVDSGEVVGQRCFQLPTEINVGGLQHELIADREVVFGQCNKFGLITSKLAISCPHQKISKLVTCYLYCSYYGCCVFHHCSVYRCFGTDAYVSVCNPEVDIALVTKCVWMYREEEECTDQSLADIFPDAGAEML